MYIKTVEEFNKKYGLDGHHLGEPGFPVEDMIRFRIEFLLEELHELAHSCGFHIMSNQVVKNYFKGEEAEQQDLEGALDALVDLQYVLSGTVLFFGMEKIFDKAFTRVHEANMQKVRAERPSDSKRGSGYDVVKPADWKAPTFEDLLGNGNAE